MDIDYVYMFHCSEMLDHFVKWCVGRAGKEREGGKEWEGGKEEEEEEEGVMGLKNSVALLSRSLDAK